MLKNWLAQFFSGFSKKEKNSQENASKPPSATGSSKSAWSSHVRKTKTPRILPDTIEKATVDYILKKYKNEAFNSMAEQLRDSGIAGVNEQRIKEVTLFLAAVLQVVEDDFFIGYRLLKKRMIKIDNYLFSQYRKDINLRPNIYKLLMFAQNKRFSGNFRENLTAYFAVIEEMNFEIIQFLEDYYVILEKLEHNPKSTLYLKKDYGIKKTYTKEVDDFAPQSEQTVLFFTQSNELSELAPGVGMANSPQSPNNKLENKAFPSSAYTAITPASHTNTVSPKSSSGDLQSPAIQPREKDMFDLDDEEPMV